MVIAAMLVAIAIAVFVVGLVSQHFNPILILAVCAAAATSFALRRKKVSPSNAQHDLFQELSVTAFGTHGYVAGPNARPEDRPVPIRSMRTVLPPAAFEALNAGTRDWMRIDAASTRSELGRTMLPELEKLKKVALLELEQEVEPMIRFPEGTPALSPRGVQLLKQLNEVANLLTGVALPIRAEIGGGNPVLEQTLVELRARSEALKELSAELPNQTEHL